MELKKICSELQELTFEQSSGINGGETLWYWIAYLAGAVTHGIVDDINAAKNGTYKQSAGSATMYKALG